MADHILLMGIIFSVTCAFGLVYGQNDVYLRLTNVANVMPDQDGRTTVRDHVLVPHLYENDIIVLQICTKENINIDLANLAYSNDGQSETIALKLDGNLVGKFDTVQQSDWGRFWDKVMGSGKIGNTVNLAPGRHDLVLQVERSGDCYGVELQMLHLKIDKSVDQAAFWCGENVKLAPTKSGCNPLPPARTTTTPRPTTTTLPPNYVTVKQLSRNTTCIDKINVRVLFTLDDLTGASITARSNITSKLGTVTNPSTVGVRFCEKGIWQIGEVDGDNKELYSYLRGRSLTVNITNELDKKTKFPAKILPFLTKDISINFNLPSNLIIQRGSAYFTLGLVNVTKNVKVGLQYYDHQKRSFSDVHFMTFTTDYDTMGWNIPNFGKSSAHQQTLKLIFESNTNIIMFDFLKLDFNSHDERKSRIFISERAGWRMIGYRYADSKGMSVSADGETSVVDLEEITIFNKVFPNNFFQAFIRIHSNGLIFPYKPYAVSSSELSKLVVDVTGFAVNHDSSSATPPAYNPIEKLHFNTATDVIMIMYKDRSALTLKIITAPNYTQLQITSFQPGKDQSGLPSRHSIMFVSTFVNDSLAAVNEISNDDNKKKHVMDRLTDLNGNYAYTFTKTSPIDMFYTNNKIDIRFSNN